MSNKNKFLLFIFSLFFIVSVLAVIITLTGKKSDLPQQPEQLLVAEEGGGISVVLSTKKLSSEQTLVVNYFDGYTVNLPSEWSIPQQTNSSFGFRAHFPQNIPGPESNTPSAVFLINPYSNPKSFTPSQWLRNSSVAKSLFLGRAFTAETLNSGLSAQKSKTGSVEEISDEKPLPTTRVDYILSGNSRIFVVSCIASGQEQEHESLFTQCESAIQTFKVLE